MSVSKVSAHPPGLKPLDEAHLSADLDVLAEGVDADVLADEFEGSVRRGCVERV